MNLKFTKEIKNNWLNKLKSGEYIQAFNRYQGENINGKQSRCCIAVLGTCTEVERDAYDILDSINHDTCTILIRTNDNKEYQATGKRDYSNVIPLIEQLPTVD